MKKYLIAAAFIICAPQTLLAQSEMFYVVLDQYDQSVHSHDE